MPIPTPTVEAATLVDLEEELRRAQEAAEEADDDELESPEAVSEVEAIEELLTEQYELSIEAVVTEVDPSNEIVEEAATPETQEEPEEETEFRHHRLERSADGMIDLHTTAPDGREYRLSELFTDPLLDDETREQLESLLIDLANGENGQVRTRAPYRDTDSEIGFIITNYEWVIGEDGLPELVSYDTPDPEARSEPSDDLEVSIDDEEEIVEEALVDESDEPIDESTEAVSDEASIAVNESDDVDQPEEMIEEMTLNDQPEEFLEEQTGELEAAEIEEALTELSDMSAPEQTAPEQLAESQPDAPVPDTISEQPMLSVVPPRESPSPTNGEELMIELEAADEGVLFEVTNESEPAVVDAKDTTTEQPLLSESTEPAMATTQRERISPVTETPIDRGATTEQPVVIESIKPVEIVDGRFEHPAIPVSPRKSRILPPAAPPTPTKPSSPPASRPVVQPSNETKQPGLNSREAVRTTGTERTHSERAAANTRERQTVTNEQSVVEQPATEVQEQSVVEQATTVDREAATETSETVGAQAEQIASEANQSVDTPSIAETARSRTEQVQQILAEPAVAAFVADWEAFGGPSIEEQLRQGPANLETEFGTAPSAVVEDQLGSTATTAQRVTTGFRTATTRQRATV